MNAPKLTRKDFQTDQDVRWCPGCGDYSILAALQKILPERGKSKEDLVVISGIGCSSRLPYYIDAYGFHTIHGRALCFATGLKSANPEIEVWVATGDGDSLSIGGNHLIHALRRNIDVNILLFNNRIYGLTKGQYSPTSEQGKKTKSTPVGSIDRPFVPMQVALGAGATFIARTIDRNAKHMTQMMQRAAGHAGTSLLEIYQNCNIFNDGAFSVLTDKETKAANLLFLEQGKPLIFGESDEKAIVQRGFVLEVVDKDSVDESEIIVHDERAPLAYHQLLAGLSEPTPVGVIRSVPVATYDQQLNDQVDAVKEKMGPPDIATLLRGRDFWEIE
ncbi:MAG: 2-oxoglutarate ferredoxin oxidoreductase subunit beta [Bradymonadia bacterium]|jgi:2-oxoglutarate ferredoxin oxidoreductase subunit beta